MCWKSGFRLLLRNSLRRPNVLPGKSKGRFLPFWLARPIPEILRSPGKRSRIDLAPRIHTFLPASRAYRDHFLKKSAAETVALAASAIRNAKQYTSDVEFTLMDAFRAAPERVVELASAAAAAGATTINLADTVGYATPFDVSKLLTTLRNQVELFDRVVFSVHCHNDLGLAVANSLAAIAAGAAQVHCTVNGIGERAGNASLEELAAALSVHADQFGVQLGIQLNQTYPASRLVRHLTGINPGPHKPVVGENVFSHEVMVPQLSDTLENPPYGTLEPEKLGIQLTGDALTAETSLEAFQNRLGELGYEFESSRLHELYADFKEFTEKRKMSSIPIWSSLSFLKLSPAACATDFSISELPQARSRSRMPRYNWKWMGKSSRIPDGATAL